ncbi:MAG: hypothetical protein R3F13_05140 [Prosthecobacter sp.]
MDGKPKAPKRRRWLRWLGRLVLIALAIGSALLYFAWKERVLLVNAVLLRAGGDFRVQLKALEWADGILLVKGADVTHAPTAHRIAAVGEVEWRPVWHELREKNLGRLKVKDAEVDLPLTLFSSSNDGDGGGSATPWRVDSVELGSTRFSVHDEAGESLVSGRFSGRLTGGTKVEAEAVDLSWQGHRVIRRVTAAAEFGDRGIALQEARIEGCRVDLAWLPLPVPLRGGFELEWRSKDLVVANGELAVGGSHEWRLKNVLVEPGSGTGGISVAAANFDVTQVDGLWRLQEGTVSEPKIDWTLDLEELLMPKSESQAGSAQWKVQIDRLVVTDGRANLAATKIAPLIGGLSWSVTLEGLAVSPEGVSSAMKQKIEVRDVALRWDRAGKEVPPLPFAELKAAELEVVPDDWRDNLRIESLVVMEPKVSLTPENGPWFDEVTEEPVAQPAGGMIELPLWKRVSFGRLTLTGGRVDAAVPLAKRVELSSRVEVTTDAAKQHLRLTDTRARVPKQANLPVLALESVEAVGRLPEIWRSRRLESLSVLGGQIEVGDALMTLFSGDAAVVEEKVDAAAERWTAAQVNVAGLGVTIMSLAPGLPPVRFDVEFAAKETPLDLDGLAENAEPQRIVLSRLRIPSPYEPLRTVAEMDVIHVNYTLDGLLHRRIDKVEIVSPLLYVGEDLFWYVESYRKFMDGEAPKGDPSFGPPLPPKPTAPGWKVDTLAVSDGRLILAPKGVPLAGFSRPFPFSFTSKLESGQLEAVFEIPTDDYTLKDLKLAFRGMKGNVQFNLPLKDRSNNLTETFTVDQIRWKDLHIEKAHLSVTYDSAGIYGQFGGEAYAGYMNGAFDFYLDEVYTWDGWVTGVDMNLGPMTRALFPGYLLLEGKADVKVIATGNKNELYQGDAEFSNRSRGKFSIEALNDMIDELPPVKRGDIADQITRIGLETLRDFDYESIDGKARLYGREGSGHLRFTGPHGFRKIDINVFDHRWKAEPKPVADNDD